jgi:hypothetical protein
MTSFASTFEIEQKANRCHRRCVIGKVMWKRTWRTDVGIFLDELLSPTNIAPLGRDFEAVWDENVHSLYEV